MSIHLDKNNIQYLKYTESAEDAFNLFDILGFSNVFFTIIFLQTIYLLDKFLNVFIGIQMVIYHFSNVSVITVGQSPCESLSFVLQVVGSQELVS